MIMDTILELRREIFYRNYYLTSWENANSTTIGYLGDLLIVNPIS